MPICGNMCATQPSKEIARDWEYIYRNNNTADNPQTVTVLGFHNMLWRLCPHLRGWGRLLPSATSQAAGEHSPVSPPSSSAMSIQRMGTAQSGLCSCKRTRQDWPISVPLVSLLKARRRQTSLCNAVYQRKCSSERVYNIVLNIKTEMNTPGGPSDTQWHCTSCKADELLIMDAAALFSCHTQSKDMTE